MRTDDFDYYLPEELIAQTPLENRSDSKLLIMDRDTGDVQHEIFSNIVNYLDSNDVLVFNDTKVIPARLIGEKEDTHAVIEVLLLKDLGDNTWECLTKPAKRIHISSVVSFGGGKLKLECIKKLDDGITHYKLKYNGILMEILDELGSMPLPPYIHEKLENKDRYQTVYAKNIGSAAAPTAGLHFTNKLIKKIKDKGVECYFVTLHVGLGTFRPVNVDDVTKHVMHSEEYFMSDDVAQGLNKAKKSGKNIISVGTTSTRVLETVYSKYNEFRADSGSTNIFIYPGYKFKAIDSLITNFHLPKSTLIMLVSALSTKDNIMNAYKIAVENKYRFFSFGDSMFIKKNKQS